jgi:hypothetical protein
LELHYIWTCGSWLLWNCTTPEHVAADSSVTALHRYQTSQHHIPMTVSLTVTAMNTLNLSTVTAVSNRGYNCCRWSHN